MPLRKSGVLVAPNSLRRSAAYPLRNGKFISPSSVNKPFAIFHALDANLGPNAIFTRNSLGSYICYGGTITYAEPNQARFELIDNEIWYLNEGPITNVISYSQDFSNPIWERNAIAVTSNYSIAPDKTLTGDRIQYDGLSPDPNLVHIQDQVLFPGGTASKEITASVCVKGTGQFRLKNTHGGVTDNFSNNFIATDQWEHYSLTVTNDASTGTGFQIFGLVPATSNSAFDLQIWGYQGEESPIRTSYFPTTGTPLTREPDELSWTFPSNFNQSEGILTLDFRFGYASGIPNKSLISFDSIATNVLYVHSSERRLKTYDGLNATFVPNITFLSATPYRGVVRWNAALNELQIGYKQLPSGDFIWGDISPYKGSFTVGAIMYALWDAANSGISYPTHLKRFRIYDKDFGHTWIEGNH